jgi:hypothetical protein
MDILAPSAPASPQDSPGAFIRPDIQLALLGYAWHDNTYISVDKPACN